MRRCVVVSFLLLKLFFRLTTRVGHHLPRAASFRTHGCIVPLGASRAAACLGNWRALAFVRCFAFDVHWLLGARRLHDYGFAVLLLSYVPVEFWLLACVMCLF